MQKKRRPSESTKKSNEKVLDKNKKTKKKRKTTFEGRTQKRPIGNEGGRESHKKWVELREAIWENAGRESPKAIQVGKKKREKKVFL